MQQTEIDPKKEYTLYHVFHQGWLGVKNINTVRSRIMRDLLSPRPILKAKITDEPGARPSYAIKGANLIAYLRAHEARK